MIKVKNICVDCGKELNGHTKPIRCKSCAQKLKGLPHTEEAKRKISDSLIGNKRRYIHGMSKNQMYKRAKSRIWRRKNPEKQKKIRQARSARMKAGGPLTVKTIQQVYEENIKLYGTLTCIYCLNLIKFGNDTLEHKIALANGGTNEYDNLAIACNHCNSSKRHSKKFRPHRRIS